MTIYVGIFCHSCAQFNVISTYELERVGDPIKRDLLGPVEGWPCQHCGDTSEYLDSAIAHCLSPGGSGPRYPRRC